MLLGQHVLEVLSKSNRFAQTKKKIYISYLHDVQKPGTMFLIFFLLSLNWLNFPPIVSTICTRWEIQCFQHAVFYYYLQSKCMIVRQLLSFDKILKETKNTRNWRESYKLSDDRSLQARHTVPTVRILTVMPLQHWNVGLSRPVSWL